MKVSEKYKSDGATDYLLSLYSTFTDSASWMADIFRNDDADFLGISADLNKNKGDTYRDWVTSVYGLRMNNIDSWKDTSNIGALKLRSKYNALVAHLMSDILKDGKITGTLKHTSESDIQELINKNLLDFDFEPTPEQVQQLIIDSDDALEKATSILLDNKEEGCTEEVYYQSLRDLCKYGICAIETSIREDKKIRNYSPEIIQNEEGQGGLKLVPTAGFKDSFIVKSKRISPYNIFLDPEAGGDPQSGVGVFKREKIDVSELNRLIKTGDYDTEKLSEIIDEHNASISKNSQGNTSVGSVLDSGTVTATKPFLAVTFWGDISKSDIESWKKESPLVKELIKELKNSLNVDYTDKYATFPVQAVMVDEVLVYLSPLLTANQQRPIAYGRMIPLEDTNYAMGIFALGREPARVMSKIWSRALNNETIVGSAMFSFDPKVVDESTLVFKPGGRIRLKPGSSLIKGNGNNSGGLYQQKFESVSQALLVLFDKLDLLLDELTMIPRNLIGVSDSSRRTATEVSSNMSSAQVILLGIRRNFDRDIIKVDLDHTYHYLQNDPSTPQDALADAYVQVYGAETFALKIINKQMVQELLQIIPSLAQVAPELLSSFNWTELISSVLEGLGFDKSKFLNTPELKTQLENAESQLQQMSEQLSQSQEQLKEVSGEVEKVENENDDLKLKNHQISSQGKVEAKLNLEQLKNSQLQEELKRLNEQLSLTKKACGAKNDK